MKKKLKVLIIGDNSATTIRLARIFEIRRHVTVLVNSPEEGLTLSDGTFDLAVVDMEMPEQWGDALLREMQRRGVAAPTILTSANWRALGKQKRPLVANGLRVVSLIKPFTPLGVITAAAGLEITL